MNPNDTIRRLQELNLGVEAKTEDGGKTFAITTNTAGEVIILDMKTGEWTDGDKASDDQEALIEYVKVLSDEANTPRVSAGDSSEPEGRGKSSPDNNSGSKGKSSRS